MREIPECLNRRYRALDELIKELTAAVPDSARPSHENSQIGIKLMCDFWNILKDDPDCNLPAEVQQRMCTGKESSSVFGPHHYNCYATGKDLEKCDDRRRDCTTNRVRHISAPIEPKRYGCGQKTDTAGNDKIPLSKVLCNLKEAASFDKQCNVRVGELVAAQKELTEQIQTLEKREKDGVMLLKQADCMWSCMEDTYKKKLADSQERQKDLFKELKQVEISTNKWRKNKKDLDFQLVNINKCHSDIVESINQKKNDIKVMNMEIDDLTKRVQNNVKDINIAKNAWRSKKDASDARIANIAQELAKIQKKVAAEQQFKYNKEQEGSNYVKDAREDLQKICRVLLQKKLENEDLLAEKDALLQEIDLLKQTCDNCKEKCTNKEKNIADEMKRIDDEAAQYKAKCIRCHQCTDTTDVRKFCTDCPRCLAERDCLYEDGHCSPDHTMDCVCMSVKQKFLDNVFDNMYTVLERQVKTCPGKAVADCILNCLKRSRNGKLNQETRKVVQDFILSTVKKNLNLTIVGGAVKTRCEMDPETYKQLMLCLKEVNATRPKKEDKGTASKKESCRRWGGTSECNCPKGPKACICLKKAPQPPKDLHSCGLQEQTEESDVKTCPQREALACGTDCGMLGLPIAEAAGWRRESCQGQTCPFSNNMRAAQCVLGPESLASVPKSHPTPPIIPKLLTEKMATCTCGGKAIQPCPCCEDRRSLPRQRIIEEVMGRYREVTPIDNVTRVAQRELTRNIDTGCDCSNSPEKYLLASNISDNNICRFCACSSKYVPHEVRSPYLKKLRKKRNICICRSSKSNNDAKVIESVLVQPDFRFEMPQRIKTVNKISTNDIKVILCPKFPQTCDDKKEISPGTSQMQTTKSTDLRLNIKSSSKIKQGLNSRDASIVGRKVCETIRELMKDIVVPELPPKDNNVSSSEVEWVTIESISKETNSLTKMEDLSTDTVKETEVKCETLEASKDFTLIDKDRREIKSIPNNIMEIQQNTTTEQNNNKICIGISGYILKNEGHTNLIAEELKSKLLDDIRQTYNISVEPSLDYTIPLMKERDVGGENKSITRCSCYFEEGSTDQNDCNCMNSRRQKCDSKQIKLRKTKRYCPNEKSAGGQKCSKSSGINQVKQYLLAISNQQSENKVKAKNAAKRLNKNRKSCKKSK